MKTFEYNDKIYNLDRFIYFEKYDSPHFEDRLSRYSIICHTAVKTADDDMTIFTYGKKSVRDCIWNLKIKGE